MHLEKIEITGFKSFADKTVLRFDQPITAIVGPNGCGKSNIVDAFRWVLGEGSAKSLRSDKMVDVIFSGSSTRKPLNYAQIALTFTEVSDSLSLGYQELCIARRIHRNGESEWTINRNPVRLKDVYKILWEAGIGKNAFYIFEQGKVDELITSSPLERRCIFEEAAKIMHFKEKKKESLRKLTQVEDNLKRVLDIQAEVNQQIETLQKQAEEARIYAANKARLEMLSKGLVVYKWKHNKKKHLHEQNLCEENAKKQKQGLEELESFETQLKELKEAHSLKSQEARKSYEALFEVKKSKELATFEFTTHQKRLEETEKIQKNIKESLQALHQRHLKEHRLFQENQTHLKTHENELVSLSGNLQKIQETLMTLEKTVEEEAQLRKQAQQQLMRVVETENSAQSQIQQNTAQLRRQKEQLAEVIHREKKCQQLVEEKTIQQASLSETYETLVKETQIEKATLITLTQELENKTKLLDEVKERLKERSSKRAENKATLDLLKNLKSEFEGYNQASKKLLLFAQEKEHCLYQKVFPLTDWFQPKKGFEASLSTILQPYLQTLVVKTDQDLKEIQRIAQENNLQNFSCFSLEAIEPKEAPASLDIAEENEVSLHFLKQLQEKSALIQGDYYLDELSVYHRISSEDQNLFLREVELKKRELEQKEIEEEYSKLQKQADILLEKVTDLKKEKNRLYEQTHQKDLLLTRTQLSLKNEEEALKREKINLDLCASQKEALSCSIAELEEKQKEIVKEGQSHEESRKQQQAYFSKIESQFETHFETLKEKRGLKERLENKIKSFEKETSSLKESIRVFESKSLSFEDQVKEMSQSIESKSTELTSLQKQTLLFEKKEQAFTLQLKEAQQHYQSFETALEEIEKKQKEKENALKELRKTLDTYRNEEVLIKSRLSEIQAELNLQTQEIEERLEISEAEIPNLEVDPSITLGKTEREISKLKRELESQPEINLKAISECEKQQSRFEFLQSQVDDLRASQEKFLEIITKLDETSRTMFQETFEKIRERFRENFLLLFNGGEADLQLTSNQDILDAGIDIIAQPPGKKMRSIQLLSGGEKCLCAIALLFALFETQSIPFCILDEIDAPLDDTNIERFTNVLKQFVKNNQFIIITHNKRTMAIADNLLGVSMQERGVTKIIPLEFTSKTCESSVIA